MSEYQFGYTRLHKTNQTLHFIIYKTQFGKENHDYENIISRCFRYDNIEFVHATSM